MPIPESAIGPAILSITQGIGLFNTLLPKLTDIRRTDPQTDPEFAADVRLGEFAAFSLLVGVGFMATFLTESEWPLLISVITGIGLVTLYEWTLRGRRFSGAEA